MINLNLKKILALAFCIAFLYSYSQTRSFCKISQATDSLLVLHDSIIIQDLKDLPSRPDIPERYVSLFIVPSAGVEDVVNIDKHTFEFYARNQIKTKIKYVSPTGTLTSDDYHELLSRFDSYYNYSFAIKDPVKLPILPKKMYQYIQPPIKGLDIDNRVYTINVEKGNTLYYPSGTIIYIPENSFCDEKGNPVSGNINITYREFRDPVDILVSGIPMKYDSAGATEHFESAGMFEINASKDERFLKLVKGKEIKMNFATTSKDSSFNFYAFNDSTGNWDYKLKPKTVTASTKITDSTSKAVQYFSRWNKVVKYRDTTKFNARFEDPRFAYTVLYDSVNKKYNRVSHYKRLRSHSRSTLSLIKISNVRKLKSGEIIFKVKFYYEDHPELNEFNNFYFVSNENLSLSAFKRMYSSRKAFNDIRISKNGSGIELRLKSSGAQPFQELSASLATLDKKRLKEVRSTASVLKRYERRLSNRQKEFDMAVKRGKNYQDKEIEVRNPNDLNLVAYNNAKALMTGSEKRMTQSEWMKYYQEQLEKEKQMLNASAATANNLVNSLSLDGMGIYNCDQIQRLEEPVEIFAHYYQDSVKMKPVATYIIDKKINAVLQYNGYRGFSADKIAFSKSRNAENVMLAIEQDGSMAIYTTEDFRDKSFHNKRKFNFHVNEVDVNFTSVSQLKKYIGL